MAIRCVFFKLQIHQNSFSQDTAGEAYDVSVVKPPTTQIPGYAYEHGYIRVNCMRIFHRQGVLQNLSPPLSERGNILQMEASEDVDMS